MARDCIFEVNVKIRKATIQEIEEIFKNNESTLYVLFMASYPKDFCENYLGIIQNYRTNVFDQTNDRHHLSPLCHQQNFEGKKRIFEKIQPIGVLEATFLQNQPVLFLCYWVILRLVLIYFANLDKKCQNYFRKWEVKGQIGSVSII